MQREGKKTKNNNIDRTANNWRYNQNRTLFDEKIAMDITGNSERKDAL
jgi:hypothetical protein